MKINSLLQNVDVCRVSKLFSLGIDHVLPLAFPFKQCSHLHRTKATFRTLSHEQIRPTFETRRTSEFCNTTKVVSLGLLKLQLLE